MRVRTFIPAALAAVAIGVLVSPADLVAQQKSNPRPLDHSVYEIWNSLTGQRVSPDGRWALYSLTKEVGDGSFHVRSTDGEAAHDFERGVNGAFTYDSAHALFRIKPPHEDTRAARRAKKKPDDMPNDALGVLNLSTGELTTIERIKSFKTPDKAGGWAAALLEKPLPAPKPDADKPEANPAGESTEKPAEKPAETKPEPAGADADKSKKKKDRKDGTPLLLINLATGAQRTFDNVLDYTFNDTGTTLAFVVSTKSGAGDADGVHTLDLADPGAQPLPVMTGPGEYTSLAFSKPGDRLAFLSNRDDFEADEPDWTVHLWETGDDSSSTIAAAGDRGVPDGWAVSQHRAPSFSESGERLFFGVAPRPTPKPDPDDEATPLPDELPKLDVWHWDEPDLHTIQLYNLDRERRRSYDAVAHLELGARLTMLADEEWRDAEVGFKGDAAVAVASRDEPYRKMIQWDVQVLRDLALVNPETGDAEIVLEAVKAQPARGSWLSPEANYIMFWDYNTQHWLAYDIAGRELINLSEHIPHPVADEDHDSPSPAGAYGVAGWLDGDRGVLIYDRFDVWLVDPKSPGRPRSITEGAGRRDGVRFRVVSLDRERVSIDPAEPLLLSAFDTKSRNSGFYSDSVRGSRRPEQLIMAARRFSNPVRAENADTLILTRESFREFPDLWASNADLSSMTRLSDANPQQADYAWGDVKLVEWTSARGEPLEGLLYTPPGFDPSKQYPMMVYFYERNSDTLHSYSPPTPSRSIIRFSFYASRGYVIFVPDIVYRDGHPGRSAMESVMPGITSLIEQGFVDRDRIGVQGHSWGGYQSAYMITQTDIFAAAGSGAPVSNMTSAYGGIRWGSGLSRQFQYERTQSRIGGTLWEKPLLYLENSPLFHLVNVTTPVLILHNDEDGAVPWEQGIELFAGLRRLGKPAWFLNYNGQPHWPVTYPNRKDYAIRMQQFFDHFLLDAPAPDWMKSGVPAKTKGLNFGYDISNP